MFTSSGTKRACGTRPKKLTMARTGRSTPARRARSSISPRFERSRSCSDRYVSGDRKSTRLNSSHGSISYAVFCLKKKKKAFIDGADIDELDQHDAVTVSGHN